MQTIYGFKHVQLKVSKVFNCRFLANMVFLCALKIGEENDDAESSRQCRMQTTIIRWHILTFTGAFPHRDSHLRLPGVHSSTPTVFRHVTVSRLLAPLMKRQIFLQAPPECRSSLHKHTLRRQGESIYLETVILKVL
jgi:hypothetical protein